MLSQRVRSCPSPTPPPRLSLWGHTCPYHFTSPMGDSWDMVYLQRKRGSRKKGKTHSQVIAWKEDAEFPAGPLSLIPTPQGREGDGAGVGWRWRAVTTARAFPVRSICSVSSHPSEQQSLEEWETWDLSLGFPTLLDVILDKSAGLTFSANKMGGYATKGQVK